MKNLKSELSSKKSTLLANSEFFVIFLRKETNFNNNFCKKVKYFPVFILFKINTI